MNEILNLYAHLLILSHNRENYFLGSLENILNANIDFAYIDSRKEHSHSLLKSLKKVFKSNYSNELLKSIIFNQKPSYVKQIISLFPNEFYKSNWKYFCENINDLSISEKRKAFSLACNKIVNVINRILQSKEISDDKKAISSLLKVSNFKSDSGIFPDYMFPVSFINGNFYDGSLLELKDSKGSSISSFNSTIPTQFKTLNEIGLLNKSDIVSNISSIIDYPYSKEPAYKEFKRRCFYFVRTNNDKPSKVKLSIIEGSFFETIPKEKLIAETMKEIAKEHLGSAYSSDLGKIFEKINDQAKIARSHSDIKTIINGNEKMASVSPRFRIMTEVTSDGNPHLYPEILERTFNLILQVSPTRQKDNSYQKMRKRLISSLLEQLNNNIKNKFKYDRKTNKISNKSITVWIKEIEHKRNGLHLVFQFKF